LQSWIVPAHHDAWRDFAAGVTAGASLSVECDLTDSSGVQRSVAFHGVPLLDHADGLASVILGARDVTTLRHLEAALHESEAIRQKLAEDQTMHHLADSDQMKMLEARLNQVEADRDQLERALTRLPQLEELLKQGRAHLQELRNRLAEATQERERLAAQLTERESANEQLWAEQADLQQSLGERQQRDLNELRTQLEQEVSAHQGEVTSLQTRLDEAIGEKELLVGQLADRVCQHEQALTQLEGRHRHETEAQQRALDELRVELEHVTRDRHHVAEEQRQELEALRMRYDESLADRDRLTEQLREMESSRQQVAAASEIERTRLEEALSSAREEIEQGRREASRVASLARQILQDGEVGRPEAHCHADDV
jgi:chromosome segregation ATPase